MKGLSSFNVNVFFSQKLRCPDKPNYLKLWQNLGKNLENHSIFKVKKSKNLSKIYNNLGIYVYSLTILSD